MLTVCVISQSTTLQVSISHRLTSINEIYLISSCFLNMKDQTYGAPSYGGLYVQQGSMKRGWESVIERWIARGFLLWQNVITGTQNSHVTDDAPYTDMTLFTNIRDGILVFSILYPRDAPSKYAKTHLCTPGLLKWANRGPSQLPVRF